MTRKLTALLAVGALAGFAGCGDDDSDDTSAAPPANTPAESAPAEGAPAEAEAAPGAVAMKGIRFLPGDITVKVGDTITWTNEDPVDHDAVDEEGGKFKSELFGKGETFEYTAEEAGTINYVCTVHPGMDGTITVTE
jgi:plastocyanin